MSGDSAGWGESTAREFVEGKTRLVGCGGAWSALGAFAGTEGNG